MQSEIVLDHVGKEFNGKHGRHIRALQEINIVIREGEVIAVIGPSGCGKSTLLNLIAGFECPSAGRIFFDGKEITAPGSERGVCFQEGALFPWLTVSQNIEFGPLVSGVDKNRRRELVEKYVKMVGLTGFEDKHPHELSGGMRQRCAVARVLANNPKVMLMDEALGAVDDQARIILQEELTRLLIETEEERKKILIWVTHSVEEAIYMADRLLIMTARPGKIKQLVNIDLPRPRTYETRKSVPFCELCAHVWRMLKDEAMNSMYHPVTS